MIATGNHFLSKRLFEMGRAFPLASRECLFGLIIRAANLPRLGLHPRSTFASNGRSFTARNTVIRNSIACHRPFSGRTTDASCGG